jgi:hypothetical protein
LIRAQDTHHASFVEDAWIDARLLEPDGGKLGGEVLIKRASGLLAAADILKQLHHVGRSTDTTVVVDSSHQRPVYSKLRNFCWNVQE